MPEKKRRRNGIMPVREYVRFHANQIPDHPLRRKSSRINFGLHTLDCNPSSPILPRFGHILYSKIPPLSPRAEAGQDNAESEPRHECAGLNSKLLSAARAFLSQFVNQDVGKSGDQQASRVIGSPVHLRDIVHGNRHGNGPSLRINDSDITA